MRLELKIFDVGCLIEATDEELINRLKKDFDYFIAESLDSYDLVIATNLGEPPFHKIPSLVSSGQSLNSITYDQGDIRYNDYYKEALTIFDYQNETCEIFAKNMDRLHELTYLIILSRTGLKMDHKGLHKIHASAIHKNGTTIVAMLPMKGGKTTLFCNMIKDPQVKIISDDTPIVDRHGNIHAFPLRVGLEGSKDVPEEYKNEAYTLERAQYGLKYLIPTTKLGREIHQASANDKVILINGIRCSHRKCELQAVSWPKMVGYLATHLIVGVGLPMILEYFLRPNLKTWIGHFHIGMSRFWAAVVLAKKSQNYICYMGENPELNAQTIKAKFL